MVECCNAPDVTFHICNSDSCHFSAMCYDITFVVGFCLSFALCSCHAFRIMSSCAYHLHTCSSHASEHFPRCPFCNPTLPPPPAHPSCFPFRERVLNVLGMDRALPSGPGIAPVDHLSSFGSFGARLALQRLSAYPQRPLLGCSPTPLQNSPLTHLSHFHALRRRITIVWARKLHLFWTLLPPPTYK